MKSEITIVGFAIILLMPVYAGAQAPADNIIVAPDLGSYQKGEYVFIHGQIATTPQGFVITQILNPRGELCNIQQLVPISSGSFVTDSLVLRGSLCGVDGKYDVRIFYGESMTTSSFTVEPTSITTVDDETRFNNAKSVLDRRIGQTPSIDTTPFRLTAASIVLPFGTVDDVSDVYSDLLAISFSDATLDGLDVTLRRSVSGALDAIDKLESAQTIPVETSSIIREMVYHAIFFYEIGDKKTSSDLITTAYSTISEFDPISLEAEAPVTYAGLKRTLLGLIYKNSTILSVPVRDELAFILARGTAPVYADELSTILDILTKTRYLEITSKNQNDLNRLVSREWRDITQSVFGAQSIESLVSLKSRIDTAYDAAFLLRDLDKVERFVNNGISGGLGDLIQPEWNTLRQELTSVFTIEGVLSHADTIRDLKAVSEISSRIEQVITLTRANRIDNQYTSLWNTLLERVHDSNSLSETLVIVGQFNDSINALREARNPISELQLEFRALKAKAEMTFDRTALANIENAQRILALAEELSTGQTTTKLDRIEVLLVWVANEASEISRKLDSYTSEDNARRSSQILQSAQSLENLAEIGLRTKRFVPGYIDYIEDIRNVVERTRALVISGELGQADGLIRNATLEWREIDDAYRETPPDSDEYGIVDISRREFQKHADDLDSVASRFLVPGTVESTEFTRILDRVGEFIAYGNFVDAQRVITDAYDYAQEHLNTTHNSVIYDVTYDDGIRAWLISGFVEKDAFDRREDISVVVQTADGTTHQRLDFTDTKHGKFEIQYDAPHGPGIYVAELLWRNTSSSTIVYIPYDDGGDAKAQDRLNRSGGDNFIAITRELLNLSEFMRAFGGERYQANVTKITDVLDRVETAISDRDEPEARHSVAELRGLIERHLPLRSPEAVIDVSYASGNLNIAGALYKSVAFPEDIYVDIFEQTGDLVVTIKLNDNPDGSFSKDLLRSFDSGIYVALLSYHDLSVSDFFSIA